MAKVKVLHNDRISSFNSDWIKPIADQYLDFELHDSTKTYLPGTLYYVNCMDVNSMQDTIDRLIDQGFKVLIDNLWETNPGPREHCYRLCCPAWFWYNESLWYRHLGYNQYRPQNCKKYKALMPMNIKKHFRTEFLKMLTPELDNIMWSYVAAGKQLPNDGDMNDWNTQRFFNPAWYDECFSSLVVETTVCAACALTPVFITEKTFKPMAFYHPFLIYGNSNILKTLKSWGFETFDNLWDESYDQKSSALDRSHSLVDIVKSITVGNYDNITQQKLQHNHNHFFDLDTVVKRIVAEIINPIIEYAET